MAQQLLRVFVALCVLLALTTAAPTDSLDKAVGELDHTLAEASRHVRSDHAADEVALQTDDTGNEPYAHAVTVIGLAGSSWAPGKVIHVSVGHEDKKISFTPGGKPGQVWCAFGDPANPENVVLAEVAKPPRRPNRLHPEGFTAAYIECMVPESVPIHEKVRVTTSIDKKDWMCRENCELSILPFSEIGPSDFHIYHDEDDTKVRIQWKDPSPNPLGIEWRNWELYQRPVYGDLLRPRKFERVDLSKRERDVCVENWCTDSEKGVTNWYLAEGLQPKTKYQWKLVAKLTDSATDEARGHWWTTPALITDPVTPEEVNAPACKFGPWKATKSGCSHKCGEGLLQQNRHIIQGAQKSPYVPMAFDKPVCFRQVRKVSCNNGPCVCNTLSLKIKGWKNVPLPGMLYHILGKTYETKKESRSKNWRLTFNKEVCRRSGHCYPAFEPQVMCRPAKMSTGLDPKTRAPRDPGRNSNYCLADFGPRLVAATAYAQRRGPFFPAKSVKAELAPKIPKPEKFDPHNWDDKLSEDWKGQDQVCKRSTLLDDVLSISHFLESTQASGNSRGGKIASTISTPEFNLNAGNHNPAALADPLFSEPIAFTFTHTHGRQSVQCEIWDYASGTSMGVFRVNPFDMKGEKDKDGFVDVTIAITDTKTIGGDLQLAVSPSLKYHMGKRHNKVTAQVKLQCENERDRHVVSFKKLPRGWLPGEHGKCPMVIAHRAVSFQEGQENSLDALRQTAAAGFDGVEIDVFLVKKNLLHGVGKDKNRKSQRVDDGYELVISHDDDMYRLLDVEGTLTDASKAARLPFLRKNTMCPLLYPLKQYLRTAKQHNLYLDVELKPGDYRKDPQLPGIPEYATEIGQRVGKLIRDIGVQKNVIVSSFDAKKLRAVNNGFTDKVRTCIATHSGLLSPVGKALRASREKDYGAKSFHYPLITKQKVERLHAKGISVGAYTIYDLEERPNQASYMDGTIKRLVEAGVDFIETDDPPRLRRKLDEYCYGIKHEVENHSISNQHLKRTKDGKIRVPGMEPPSTQLTPDQDPYNIRGDAEAAKQKEMAKKEQEAEEETEETVRKEETAGNED